MLLLELIKNEFGKYWEFNIREEDDTYYVNLYSKWLFNTFCISKAFDPTDVDMLRKYIDNNI